MRFVLACTVTCLLGSSLVVGCSGPKAGVFDDGQDASPGTSEASVDDASSSSGGGDGPQLSLTNDSGDPGSGTEPCKGGNYEGSFMGSYSSSLILGVPLAVTGNVNMTLNQYGSNMTTCTFMGESESCSNLFRLSGGTVTGVANSTQIGDASLGGYPYFCSLTGTLDCEAKALVGGWIECTYCVGSLNDGGVGCAPLLSGIGSGIGGMFAGPVTANYDYASLSFVMGTWNGAEALAGNDGGAPGPDGGPIASYLAADGGYGIGTYGGNGTWNAAHQ